MRSSIARLDDDPGARGADRRHPGPLAAPNEGVGCRHPGHVDRAPVVRADVDGRAFHRGLGQEMLCEGPAIRLDRSVEMVLREGIGRVLHRVGGDHHRVVAVRMRRLEAALQRDRDGQVVEAVTGRIAGDPDEPDRRLAIPVGCELDHGLSAAAAVRVAYRSRAMSTTASSARSSSVSRSAPSAARSPGSSSARERPATKTQ